MSQIRQKQQKKHLSNLQKERIKKIQNKDTQHQAQVIAQLKHRVLIKVEDKIISAKLRTNLPEIVVGDYIAYNQTKDDIFITTRLPRTNSFNGVTRNVVRGFAANIDGIILVCASQPKVDRNLFSAVLLNCIANNIEPIILRNKTDLTNKENDDYLASLIKNYEGCNIKVCNSSAKNNDYAELLAVLTKSTYLFFGQSGVGKSSLLNCLLPDVNAHTKTLSTATNLGQHTTSVAKLYQHKNFKIIDCPGVRQLSLPLLTKEHIFTLYPNVAEIAKNCRFRNCSHLPHELDCALQEQLKQGENQNLQHTLELLTGINSK